MVFNQEADFEHALITLLPEKGWERAVLKNPTEQDLIDNWARILFANNRTIDRLNNVPLTAGEMGQILEQIAALRTPLKLNSFINGKTVSIKRDNPADALHMGKEVSLEIYDRQEIAAGKSCYQIVQQPRFPTAGLLNDRRGDLMLLINGMPVIHIELKKSGVSVTQAARQIENYARSGVFSGLFSLVQIFVAMTPEETLYFANPGPDGTFNPDFYFHWANFDNVPINGWKEIVSTLLSIPMAHQLIGFYTVPDDTDGILKVMRSYQYYAASAISDRVAKTDWSARNQRGGYIWHTTGSGKTMTSFKSAQLIANSKDADKVIFLMDRIELGTQSLKEYQGFAENRDDVQATENTYALITRLKSANPADTLIVTSIQKLSRIKQEDNGTNAADIAAMAAKRIVFIVDEAHRSTFGDMLVNVKATFPGAIFFGFTGTPIQIENKIKGSTTTDVFGDELHRYSIADGIRDQNVLGFDPYKVLTYTDRDVRTAVALHKAKAASVSEAISNPAKKKIYYRYMNDVRMAGEKTAAGRYIKGIEDDLPKSQYQRPEHQSAVVSDILANWLSLSQAGKFHALFATDSIIEAIEYYRRIKSQNPTLKITALFDPNIDNNNGGTTAEKEAGLVEIIADYNARYNQHFDLGSHARFKKDVAARLAHKAPYRFIEREPEAQLDLLIVVDQMLTGFDSKWINTLYMDKVLEYQHVIQAFSRTNRLFGPDKPFGTIRYYRKPHTMERNVAQAVKLYSGDKPIGLFVPRLQGNLEEMNRLYGQIQQVFTEAGVPDFTSNPEDKTACGKFASLFRKLSAHLEAAKIQGFNWNTREYPCDPPLTPESTTPENTTPDNPSTDNPTPNQPQDSATADPSQTTRANTIGVAFDQNGWLVLAMRYRELFDTGVSNSGSGTEDAPPYEIDSHLTEIDTGKIDADYMNTRFDKYLKLVNRQPQPPQNLIEQALNDLHKTFATLTQEEQKYAGIFLRDIERGDAIVQPGKTLRDYITEYQARAKTDQIRRMVDLLGLDPSALSAMMGLKLTEANINEYGRFDNLKNTVNKTKARAYLEQRLGERLSPPKVNIELDKLLRRFLLEGGFDLE